MITNEAGQTALKYYQTIPHILQIGKKEYAFVVRARICMAWINPEHVDDVLNRKKTCCGGNSRTIYRPANENDVRQWTNGGGR